MSGRFPLCVSCILLSLTPASAEPPKEPLTLEQFFDVEDAQPARPSQIRWTTADRVSFFLDAEQPEEKAADGREPGAKPQMGAKKDTPRDLWVLNVRTGEQQILVSAQQLQEMAPSPEQATQDERERTRRSRFNVAAYHWSPDGEHILFTSSGQLILYTLESQKTRVLAPRKQGLKDPKFSPDGQQVAFVYEHDLWVVPTTGGAERQVTTGGHELLLHGDVDWVYAEEFRVRTGYHWSPDSRRIAFLEMDQSPVPTYPISDELPWQATVDLQRYPKPGDPNPKVRVGLVDLEKNKTAWLDRAAEYIPRIDWVNADEVAVQLLDRAQEELELVFASAETGRSKSIFFERDPHWINVSTDLTFLEDGERFLWSSDRSGLRHLYLYGKDGKLIRQLTDGEFRITEVAGVDEEAGWIYFMSNERTLLGSDLYRVKLDGSGKERLTEAAGTHRLSMNGAATAYFDDFSSLTDPGGFNFHDLASGRTTPFAERDYSQLDWTAPRLEEVKTPDGATVRLLVMAPENPQGRKLPVVAYVYGMAGVPTIRDAWLGGARGLFHQYLVQQGYVVVHIDDRSSAIPGHKHAVTADHNIGPVAAADHGVAVEHLKSLPYVDDERFAVWGWSGGGFTTTFHLGHTKLFKVGVAGAPPTDWRLYDSIYTERYMGLPDENLEAYERTSALTGAENYTGRLLLIHGTHDDNVHMQNTTKMMHALIEAGKQFDVMLYPNQTHGVSAKHLRLHKYSLIYEHIKRYL